ncbi:MAG: phosphonate metabolism protein/1,5-bisphosphokinase (PRPP-forming) PhnN [Actinomycetota bacterium]
MTGIGPGAFVAVFGGSGVGKDSILDYAHAHAHDDRLVFVRRSITRAAGLGEDHLPVSDAEFAAAEHAVAWAAHGLSYGLPIGVDDIIRNGGIAVANVSRGVLSELGRRYARLYTVNVTVPDDVRAARLLARGREDAAAIRERISRPDPAPGVTCDLEIENDGTLPEAAERLLTFLRTLAFT